MERRPAGGLDQDRAGGLDQDPVDQSDSSPVLLWAADPRRGRLVAACCPRARAAGIRVGMPIAQAVEMTSGEMTSGLADEVVVEAHDADRDDAALAKVAWWFQQSVTPMTAIESLDRHPWAGHPRHQCESLLGEVTGTAHLSGGESGLVTRITRELAEMGLAARIAIAGNLATAWAVAHENPVRSHQPADRCFIVPPEDELGWVEPLSVSALRIAPETVDTLARLGVTTIGQLLRLPRSGLAPRLGMPLVRRIEQILGEIDEPLAMYRPLAEHTETWTLEYPTTDAMILADRIRRLIDRLRTGLATRQRGALRLACRLDLSAHPPQSWTAGLFAPTLDAEHLAGLLTHRLEKLSLDSDVTRVTAAVTLSGPLRSVQASLFGTTGDEDRAGELTRSLSSSSLCRLIDSLGGRLGTDAVQGVRLRRDPLPENAFDSFPLAGRQVTPRRLNRLRAHRPTAWSASSVDAIRRPLAMMTTPKPLAVADGESFTFAPPRPDLPTRIRIGGRVHRIVRAWGPERIETGWWKGPMVARDYFRIETDRGQWWWIYRDRSRRSHSPGGQNVGDRNAGDRNAGDKNSGDRANVASRRCFRWMLHGRFS